MQISPTKSFFLGKNVGGTRHPCEKNEPTLDHSGGGGARSGMLTHNLYVIKLTYYIVLYCIVLYYEALQVSLDRYRIGIPRELSEINTQTWLSEGSLTCDPCHHRGPIF